MQVKILGEWDGEPIWRYKTAAERLLEALDGEAYLREKEDVSNKFTKENGDKESKS